MITAASHAAHTARALLPPPDAGRPPTDDEARDTAADAPVPAHRTDGEAPAHPTPIYPPLPFPTQALLARVGDAGGKMVEVNLPGLGKTFLDAEMATKVKAWIRAAHAKGVDLHFNSAYRDQAKQSSLRHDPKAITPTERSLHSAGLAVDVQYSSLRNRPGMTARQQRTVIRETAAQAGLKWGGDFKKKDPPHFCMEPAGDRQALIDKAAKQVEALRRSHA